MLTDLSDFRVAWFAPETHLVQLVKLHAECFPKEEWTARDFMEFVNKPDKNNVLKVIVDSNDCLCGDLLYTLTARSCILRRVAVFEKSRRKGFATHMIKTLTGEHSPVRRRFFVARVRESNYPAQALLHRPLPKGLGFKFDPSVKREIINGEELFVFKFEKTPVRNLLAVEK